MIVRSRAGAGVHALGRGGDLHPVQLVPLHREHGGRSRRIDHPRWFSRAEPQIVKYAQTPSGGDDRARVSVGAGMGRIALPDERGWLLAGLLRQRRARRLPADVRAGGGAGGAGRGGCGTGARGGDFVRGGRGGARGARRCARGTRGCGGAAATAARRVPHGGGARAGRRRVRGRRAAGRARQAGGRSRQERARGEHRASGVPGARGGAGAA